LQVNFIQDCRLTRQCTTIASQILFAPLKYVVNIYTTWFNILMISIYSPVEVEALHRRSPVQGDLPNVELIS
jgi:hypothetical protein